MADLDNGEHFALENKKLVLERYKAKLDFWKFMGASVFAAIAIAAIPALFQWATSVLESARKTQEFEQSKITFHETYIKDFVEKALNQDIEIRIRLARYFAYVSDKEYKESWESYLKKISDLRDNLRTEISNQERDLYIQTHSASQDEIKIAEIKRNLAWKYGELGYSAPDRDVVKNPRILSSDVQSKSILDFSVGDGIAVGINSAIQPTEALLTQSSVSLGGDSVARVAATPAMVLEMIRIAKDHGLFVSKIIVLSSGIANNTGQIDLVNEQISALREGGAKQIVLIGVSKNIHVGDVDGSLLNEKLKKIAADSKVLFSGGFIGVGPGNVHPTSYLALAASAAQVVYESLSASAEQVNKVQPVP